MAALVQTIAVVDRSGKAVTTSKQIIGIFKEARAAYRERKAEVVASRSPDLQARTSPRTIKAAEAEDLRSRTSSRSKPPLSHHTRRLSPSRQHSSTISRTIVPSRAPSPRPSIQRRHTSHPDPDYHALTPTSAKLTRSQTQPTSPKIDMDLAYGPIPPPLPPSNPTDITSLVNKTKRLLEEFDCLHFSATHTIMHLQNHPDAMAAVALTLAEISNLVSKTGPGVLATLRASSPAVFALLSSPQFLIAGGVALGVTVVAFGGFKVIKRLKEQRTEEEGGMDEMLVLDAEGSVGRIESWRRGIDGAGSEGTGSVEGEYITPVAARMEGLVLDPRAGVGGRGGGRSRGGWERRSSRRTVSEGGGNRRLMEEAGARSASIADHHHGKSHRRRKEGRSGSKTEGGSSEGGRSERSGASSKPRSASSSSAKDGGKAGGGKRERGREKEKKPSPLRLMFR